MLLTASLVIWNIDFYNEPLVLTVLLISGFVLSLVFGTLTSMGEMHFEKELLTK